MGLEATTFSALVESLKHYDNPKVLSFGVPDIFPSELHYEEYASKDEEAIKFHHDNVPYDGLKILRKALKLDVTFLEMRPGKYIDVVADLNTVVSLGKYDIIIDPGTSEHIFNIANVFRLICSSLNIGGRIFHTNPVNRINHGLYSLNPTLLKSLYELNGFTLEALKFWSGKYASPLVKDILAKPHTRYETLVPLNMMCVARKDKDIPFTFPTQFKYK